MPSQSQLWETWSDIAKSQPGRVAIHLLPSLETLTFRELDEQVRHWSEALRGHGLRPGDRILVRCGNTPAFIAVFLACLRLRKVFVPLESNTTHKQVRALADRFDARALITPRGCIPLAPATSKLSQPPEDMVLLKLTSGSTGEPRGIAHSEATLAADSTNICAAMQITPDDLNLAAISLAHSYGFSNLVLPLITQGTAMTLLHEFVPRAALHALERSRVTVFPAVPFMFECLNALEKLQPRLPHLRTCISAGAPLAPEVARNFHERFRLKIHSFYGASECGGITYDASDDTESVGTHVGTPMNGVKVNLVDGRIRVTSPAVGLAYWPHDRREESAIKVTSFLTSDLGRFDELGRIVLTGRVSNLINIAGKKVNPLLIEDCIRALDDVQQVAVLGAPDKSRGEQIVAFVVAKNLSADDILTHCRKTLASHELPRRIVLLQELPVTERGKISREGLLETLYAGTP